jgi:hypothetical protein
MFSQQSTILEADGFSDATASRLAQLFMGLAAKPSKARELRSGVVISFEKLGVNNPASDPRARAFLHLIQQGCPGFGYFLHGDPPSYFLRNVTSALTIAHAPPGHQATTHDFLRMHAGLHAAGVEYGASVFDDANVLEEVFVVNLPPELMSPDICTRARRALLPVLLMSRESKLLRRKALREAEALWIRKVADFPTEEDFIAAFERATPAGG